MPGSDLETRDLMDGYTRVVTCRSCGEYIVFLKTATGKSMPVDADSVDEGDDQFDHTKHVSHFATCPDAGKFRKSR